MKQLYTTHCLVCNQEFSYYAYPSQKQKKLCSWDCHIQNLRNKVGDKNPAWKPINEKSSYRTLKTTLRRRLVTVDTVCDDCGKPSDCLEIHHIDKNRTNNQLANLVVLCLDCHANRHKGEPAERLIRGSKNHSHNIARDNKTCPQCLLPFKPYYDAHKFCSKKCSKGFRDSHTPSKLQTSYCKYCNSPYIHKPSVRREFCSQTCYNNYRKPTR